ncbi:MAG: domain S-box protein, partial [Rhizobacter sp.]|nr:domain S-box protein [Rhizobacter sp.]
MSIAKRSSARRRSWPIVTSFVCIVALQVLVAGISIDLLAAVRSYVTGESLYSKGQKDAQIYLLDYAEYHREEDYLRFQHALSVPLGDRVAREELQKAQPDFEVARRGFIEGGNHPDDVSGLIRLFRLFHDVGFMAEPIATWTEGDRVIQQMRELAARAHERLVAGDTGAIEVREMRTQAPVLNKRLTTLESKFSAQLGDAARLTGKLLLGLNLSLALLLGLTGLLFVRRSLRTQASTEELVLQRQESLQRLLDSAAEGLYGVDLHGNCTFINRAALAMLGYSHESELLGRDIHALIHRSHLDGQPSPLDDSRIFQALHQQHKLHLSDAVLRRADGTSFPVEYWSHPMFEGGQVQGAVATFFDISDRVQMQAALREGELRMAKLVDTVMDGVITIDAHDKVIFFNRAAHALFGVSSSKAIGSPIQRFIPRGIERGAARDAVKAVASGAGGTPFDRLHEFIGVHEGGRTFPIEASLSTLVTDGGALITIVLRDATQQHAARAERQRREALEASSRAKTDFLSRMSHELRTPLNAVLGFSQLLRMDLKQPPSAEQLGRIQHIENAGTHLLALVNDVLDLSRVESGQMTVVLEDVDLQQVLAEALGMVSSLAAAADVALPLPHSMIDGHWATREEHRRKEDDSLADIPWVVADPVRLCQILVNLLSNAVKYNRPGGRVALSWQRAPEGCRLSIADTGPGMTSEKLAHLFEPFNRLGAEKSKVEGTGIGLVLSRRLAELMNGDLIVESVVGQGTIATIVLQPSKKPGARAPILAPPSQHGALDRRLDVLYVEDDEVNAELVRQVVRLRPSVALRVAESGRVALKMAQQDPPDLMLIDMNLGDMT